MRCPILLIALQFSFWCQGQSPIDKSNHPNLDSLKSSFLENMRIAYFVGKPISLLVDSVIESAEMIEFMKQDDGGLSICVFQLPDSTTFTVYLDNWTLLHPGMENGMMKSIVYDMIAQDPIRSIWFKDRHGNAAHQP
jgi:hypothetical protein